MAWLISERTVEKRIMIIDDEEPIRKTRALLLPNPRVRRGGRRRRRGQPNP